MFTKIYIGLASPKRFFQCACQIGKTVYHFRNSTIVDIEYISTRPFTLKSRKPGWRIIYCSCVLPFTNTTAHSAKFENDLTNEIDVLTHDISQDFILRWDSERFSLLQGNPVSIGDMTLHWRHDEHGGVSNHQPHECEGAGEFPAQGASNAENDVIMIWQYLIRRFSSSGLYDLALIFCNVVYC